MKNALLIFLMVLCLSACSKQEVVPIATTPDPAELLAQPPAEAMVKAHDPIPLQKGQSNSYYSGIMRENNLLCADDRAKLTTLQRYILGIFETK